MEMKDKIYIALIESRNDSMITLAINGLMLQSHQPITKAESELLHAACTLLESKFKAEGGY